MSINEVPAERLAELFHLYHEALAGDFSRLNYDSHLAWGEVPEQERKRITAAIRLALLDLGFAAREHDVPKSFFAEPGAAEWGC